MRFMLVSSSTVFLDAMISPGAYDAATKTGWTQTTTQWSYKNKTGILGIQKLKLKMRKAGDQTGC